jgi:hypothetical protein
MNYHLHIPRSGGTALLAFLTGIVPSAQLVKIYAPIQRPSELKYSGELAPQTLFYGHFSFGFHTLCNDPTPMYSTVLRHPVERVISLYHYCSENQDHHLHHLIRGRRLTLADFVAARVTVETNDLAVRYLTGSYHPLPILFDQFCNLLARFLQRRSVRRCPTRRLGAALQVLRTFQHVGCTERAGDSVAFFAEKFGYIGPNASLARLNGTGRLPQISAATRRLIESENELDLELYYKFCARPN